MTFAHPWILLLLLGVPLLAWLKGRAGQQAAFLYSSVQIVKGIANLHPSRARRLLPKLRWLALALFIVALARPQLDHGQSQIKASGIDIVVALDVSPSMAAEDFRLYGNRINRLALAKKVLEAFIDQRPGDRIGLVAFAGKAQIAAPPSLDHPFLLANLERLDLDMIEGDTAIGLGLMAALNRLRDLDSKSKIVILMTDGQNNAGNVPPLTASEVAETLGVKVYTIGVGTKGTAPEPYVDSMGKKHYRTVKVDIDEATLRKIARQTGGNYYRADSTDTLRHIYREIDQLEKSDMELETFQQYRELFPWVILSGLVLLLLEVMLKQTVWRQLP